MHRPWLVKPSLGQVVRLQENDGRHGPSVVPKRTTSQRLRPLHHQAAAAAAVVVGVVAVVVLPAVAVTVAAVVEVVVMVLVVAAAAVAVVVAVVVEQLAIVLRTHSAVAVVTTLSTPSLGVIFSTSPCDGDRYYLTTPGQSSFQPILDCAVSNALTFTHLFFV